MLSFRRKPSRTDTLEERVAALEAQVEGYVTRLELYREDAADLTDDLAAAREQHEEVELLISKMRKWAAARGFAFDAAAARGDPITQRAAQHRLAAKAGSDHE